MGRGYAAWVQEAADSAPTRRLRLLSEAVGRGLAAGVAGTVAMTASSTLEMKLRGRPPSTAPAKAVGRLLGVKPVGRKGEQRFATVAHALTGVSLGAARGVLDAAGVRRPAATLPATFAIVMAPEVLLAPALGATDPPWRWGLLESAISVAHHVAWVGAAEAAYRALSR